MNTFHHPVGRFAQRALGAGLIVALIACADLFTEAAPPTEVFDSPLDGLTAMETAAFARGDAEFSRRFAAASGLGPIFNNISCFSCHSGDGRGRPENALIRIGTPDDDFLSGIGGPQIQNKALVGAEAEATPLGIPFSLRLPPPVFGVGLMDAIPDSVLLARADSADANGDGISGRANRVSLPGYVTAAPAGAPLLIGRFGRKAQVSNLLQQVVEAYHQDMGITSSFRPLENFNPRSSVPIETADHAADPEISDATVLAVVQYIRLLAPPAPGTPTPRREVGRAAFTEIGCSSCHTPTLRTGSHAIAALANKDVALYSDLLLHDMGDGLADLRADGSASGREWRTTPLWGLRLMRQFLNGEAFLLHDGRARSVESAILLHGGEAQRARDAFVALSAARRAALLDFVETR